MDTLTIWISSVALLVSIASVGVSAWISNRDNNRTLRAQMNDLVKEMSASNEEEGINITLAMQAVSLIKQKPELLNMNDYLETAELLFYVSDWETANLYYEAAIKKSFYESDFFKIACRRAYANMLFRQHDYEKGRGMYKDALGIVLSNTDLHLTLNAYTYLMWYNNESVQVLNGASAEYYYQQAKLLYKKVSDPFSREWGLSRLELRREQYTRNIE